MSISVMTVRHLAVVGFSAALLSGCVEESAGNASSGGIPSVAEQACLRDVTGVTNNADVVLLGSTFSQAGTEVIVGVGPQRARWSCIGYSDGTTAGITSLTNEGTL
ncbi:hypothetical protein [Yoonia sediminilitoris]|uniref:Uncharacterized protein n=1 Tax=Yoonia sediminilitoris TaxID=1286148 RepID=A0A2T6K5R5_9RHOB|nr:hypothetical protein [Yoonia sediminilitoris]PUB09968.1 hypothetical protein C8N45_12320 [Yoonia sediminilitoris]RCW89637.1 hypothetical protein DFP92_12320 [Yoonia sediminilitoris]